MQIVGPIDVVASRIPWIQVDAAQIDDPEQRREIVHDREVDDIARGVLDRTGAKPIGPRFWRALHKEERTARPLRIAFHDHGAASQVRQEDGRDGGVIREQLSLGDAQGSPEWLLQIREPHLAAAER